LNRNSVSIVIATYNEYKNLTRLLPSIFSQIGKDDEVIVVDGGSTDGTVELALRYGCHVFQLPGKTLGYSRDYGVRNAKNDIVISIDADTLIPDGTIDKIRLYFRSDPSLIGIAPVVLDMYRRRAYEYSAYLLPGVGVMQIFKRNAYFACGGYPDVSGYEDIVFWERLKKVGKVIRAYDIVVYHDFGGRWNLGFYLSSAVLTIVGAMKYDHPLGKFASWLGVSVFASQLFTESGYSIIIDDMHIHHGLIGVLGGIATFIGGVTGVIPSDIALPLGGVFTGIALHHKLTEPSV